MRSVLFLIIFSAPLLAQPKLDDTSPSAISSKGGQITLHGTGLKQPLSLWSIPAAQATFSNISSDSTLCGITFPNPVHDQFLALRLATSSGISDPLLIAIDDLPVGKNLISFSRSKTEKGIEYDVAAKDSGWTFVLKPTAPPGARFYLNGHEVAADSSGIRMRGRQNHVLVATQ